MANTPFELKDKTVLVAGHRGMVGAAIKRRPAVEDVDILTAGPAALGWRARTSLQDGIALAYRAFLNETQEAAE